MKTNVSVNEWFDATKIFPSFDQKVLGYYTIPDTKKKDKIYEYYVIMLCESITESANNKRALWREVGSFDCIEPLYWCELPTIPNILKHI